MNTEKSLTLVGMTLAHAQWLGMAASVAGGCVCVSNAADDAVAHLGWMARFEMVGLVPTSWLPSPDYNELTPAEAEKIKSFLSRRFSGWSGAGQANEDYAATQKMLGLV